jgi:hypothetical protein
LNQTIAQKKWIIPEEINSIACYFFISIVKGASENYFLAGIAFWCPVWEPAEQQG